MVRSALVRKVFSLDHVVFAPCGEQTSTFKSGRIIGDEAVIALDVHGIIMSGAGRLHAGTLECPVRNLKRNWEAKV